MLSKPPNRRAYKHHIPTNRRLAVDGSFLRSARRGQLLCPWHTKPLPSNCRQVSTTTSPADALHSGVAPPRTVPQRIHTIGTQRVEQANLVQTKTDSSVDNVHTNLCPTEVLTDPCSQQPRTTNQKETFEKDPPSHVIKTVTDHEQVSDQPGRRYQERKRIAPMHSRRRAR